MHEFKAEEGFAAKKAGDNAAYPAMGRQSRTTLESGNTPMYHMFHDAERCIMCFSCEVHCKLENNLPVGPRLIRMIQVGPKVVGGRLKSQFVYLSCHHCDPAACVSACPTGAMQKRADGIVFVDEKACIGCKTMHHGLPVGIAPVQPADEEGREVQLLHGEGGPGALAGLRPDVRDPLPLLREHQRVRERPAGTVCPADRRVGRNAGRSGGGRPLRGPGSRRLRSGGDRDGSLTEALPP